MAHQAYWEVCEQFGEEDPHIHVSLSALFAVGPHCISVDPYLDPRFVHIDLTKEEFVLRELFGNPFLPVNLNPSWLTPTVKTLAQGIYEERTFTDLPILADALEEGGCTSQDLLSHLRSPGEHVRGCWALDIILDKS